MPTAVVLVGQREHVVLELARARRRTACSLIGELVAVSGRGRGLIALVRRLRLRLEPEHAEHHRRDQQQARHHEHHDREPAAARGFHRSRPVGRARVDASAGVVARTERARLVVHRFPSDLGHRVSCGAGFPPEYVRKKRTSTFGV